MLPNPRRSNMQDAADPIIDDGQHTTTIYSIKTIQNIHLDVQIKHVKLKSIYIYII